MWKKYLAFVMAMMLVLHTVPVTAYAEEDANSVQDGTVEAESEEKPGSEEAGESEEKEEAGAGVESELLEQEVSGENAGEKQQEENGEGAEEPVEDVGQEQPGENAEESEQPVEEVELPGEDIVREEKDEETESEILPVVNATGDTGEYQPEGAGYKLTYTEMTGGVKITGITGTKEGELKIPAKISGMDVVEIGDESFKGCSDLTGSLEIPDSVTVIGKEAFQSCWGLTGQLILPKDLTDIGDYAFSYCRGFSGELIIPDKVSNIGYGVFGSCIGLSGKLVLPDGLTKIYGSTFSGCTGFTGELVIPDKVTHIGSYAFSGCTGLSGKLTIPSSVETVDDYAFAKCNNISEIEILDKVKEIDRYAFTHEGSIDRKIYVYNRDVNIEFGGLGEGSTIYGYAGSMAEIRAKAGSDNTFIYLDGEPVIEEYHVKNTAELLEALGSHRKIILEDGVYDLYGDQWIDTAKYLKIEKKVNLSIEAEHPGEAELLLHDNRDPVIKIDDSAEIIVVGCILGHESEREEVECGDDGSVVTAWNSGKVEISKCDLYGCGVWGVSTSRSSVSVEGSVIRDCVKGIANGDDISLKNCVFSGNAYKAAENQPPAFGYGKNVSVSDCTFINNKNSALFYGENNGTITDCTFYNNVWDGGTPQLSGICLNGITWQMDGTSLKLGFPLELDKGTIESQKGKILDYSASAVPWKNSGYTEVQYAEGIEEPDRDKDNIAEGEYQKIKWTINSSGKLTVNGEGEFASKTSSADFDYQYVTRAPWYEYRDRIKTAEINVRYMDDASWMFYECGYLTSIDLSNFDTSRISRMQGMFMGCKRLRSLDLNKFDTRNAQYMNDMFCECEALTDLNLSSFSTSQVTNMKGMFSGCSSLTCLDLSNFDTSLVSNMLWMFNGCSSLTDIDLSSFETGQLMYMEGMFVDCNSLTSLDLSSFDGHSLRDEMLISGSGSNVIFASCYSLATIYTPFDVVGVYQLPGSSGDVWYQPDGSQITTLPNSPVSMMITKNKVPVIEQAYITATLRKTNYVCGESIATRDLTVKYYDGNGTVTKVTDYTTNADEIDMSTPGRKRLVIAYNGLTTEVALHVSTIMVESIKLSSDSLILSVGETAMLTAETTPDSTAESSVTWTSSDTSVATVQNGLVTAGSEGECTITASVGGKSATCLVTVTDGQTGETIASGSYENVRWRIDGNGKLTVMGNGDFSGSNSTNRAPWFENRAFIKAAEINLTGTMDASYMFYDCQNLTDIDLSRFDTGKVTDMTWIFRDCSSLTSLNLSACDVKNVTEFADFFKSCYALATIYVPCNLKKPVALPKGYGTNSTDIWYDADGNTYTELPQNLNSSIVLTKNKKPVISEPHITLEKQKTSYSTGEKLTTDDLKVTYYNETGIPSTVTDYTTNADEIDMSTPGTKTLVVTYRNLYAEISITVSEKQTGETKGLKITFKNEQDKEVAYTGSAVKPEIRVSYNGRSLVEGTNYTVKYANNIKVGSAKITVTGKGNFKSGKTENFKIVKADIADAVFAGTDKSGRLVVVSGSRFSPVIYCGGRKLTANDYTISGTVTAGKQVTDSDSDKVITLNGKGSYKGNKKITLRVVRKSDLIKFTVTLDKTKLDSLTYDGKAHYIHEIRGALTVTGKDGNSDMKYGTDYMIAYPANVKDAGTKKFSVIGMGFYTGTISKSYTIKPAVNTNGALEVKYELGNIENIKLPYVSTGVTFNDQLKVTYTRNGNTLTLREGKDYRVTYSGNKKVGRNAKFTISFLGNYKGIQKQTRIFAIEKAELGDSTVIIPDAVYKKTPGIYKSVPYVIESETGRLIKASNYTVTYYTDPARNMEMKGKNKVAAGDTVYVKLEAKPNSNYKSVKPLVKTYQVANAIDLSKAKISFMSAETGTSTKSAEYTGQKITDHEIKVLVNGKPADADMIVTYANNIDKGKATVIVTGTGKPECRYTGCKKATFQIVAYSLR